ncbi:MAG: glycogen synthase [Bifidobacteriaceae bacterium]|jgi:starch synthase|nr:glycogen synthase [Bifidobacteriaceae bacterium]
MADGKLQIDLLTREYPPFVYGGAGVHVAELAKVLRDLVDVRVLAFDGPRQEPGVTGFSAPPAGTYGDPVLATFGIDLEMAGSTAGADLVHSHTWYANLAGHLAGLLRGVPHVLSAHSLEPLRPWKAEQLGGGYALSCWAERTAYQGAAAIVAVSAGMRRDILRVYPFVDPDLVRVIHNGIDLDKWHPWQGPEALRIVQAHGIDPEKRSVVFVGRITRQKGLAYFLRAASQLPPEVQLVLVAGAPDTSAIAGEVERLVAELKAQRQGVIWIDQMLPQGDLDAILSQASLFVCPSIYEPLGIVNLEAMACGTPVVATATGGIPEVVEDGVTGWLVPIEQVDDGTGRPLDPGKFISDLSQTINQALSDPVRLKLYGAAGRRRAEDHFSWRSIGARTVAVYQEVLGK